MHSFPLISIIFPNYNGGKEPIDCLKSIQKLNYPKNNIEVIVIDNASSDGSDKKIKDRFPKIKLIKLDKNYGFAKAVNIGIKKAKGELIFVGNDDLVFEKNSLKNLADFTVKNPNIGVLGGKIYLKSSPRKITSSGYMINRLTGNIYKAPNPNELKEPDWVQGCAMLIPKKVFKKVGFFDEGFKHLFEDVDFCFRTRKKGYKIVYNPEAIFWHGESTSANKNLLQKYYNWYLGKLRFVLKNLSIYNILSILFVQTFLVIPFRGLVLRDGRFLPFINALFSTTRNFPKIAKERSA